jgi:predicted MPP superfamily phosphohydrolase
MEKFIIIGAALLIIAYLVYEYFQLNCRRFTRIDLKTGQRLKALLLTDLHNKCLRSADLERAAAEKPDMILLAGDMITSGDRSFINALKAVNDLCKIAPVYFSLGNHELNYRDKFEGDWKDFLSRLPENCHILDDDHISFNEHVEIYGLSLDRRMYKKGRIFDTSNCNETIFSNVNVDRFNILLAHNPDLYDYYEKQIPSDLIVSGHLHGGFVRLPFVGGIVFSCYGVKHRVKGLYDGKHIVSSGAGEHRMPLRLFNRCEIVVISF